MVNTRLIYNESTPYKMCVVTSPRLCSKFLGCELSGFTILENMFAPNTMYVFDNDSDMTMITDIGLDVDSISEIFYELDIISKRKYTTD